MAMFDSSVFAAIFVHCDLDTKLRVAGSCPQLCAQFSGIARKIVAQTGIEDAFSAGSVILAKFASRGNLDRCFRIACTADNFELAKIAVDRTLREHTKFGLGNFGEQSILSSVESDDIPVFALNRYLYVACMLGKTKAAKYVIDCGADDWTGCLGCACSNGHADTAEILVECIKQWRELLTDALALNDKQALIAAVKYGWRIAGEDEISIMTKWNEWRYPRLLPDLRNVAEKLVEDLDRWRVFGAACDSGSIAVVDMMISHGAVNWDEGLRKSCENGHPALAEKMLQLGATDIAGAFIEARRGMYAAINTRRDPDFGYHKELPQLFGKLFRVVEVLLEHDTANTIDIRRLAGYRSAAIQFGLHDFANKLRDIGVSAEGDLSDETELVD